jgi:hypothetical protein
MPILTKKKAVEAITAEVHRGTPADLAEIHNELFPRFPITVKEAERDPAAVSAKVLKHIEAGLEIEEILDLWHMLFPGHRDSWFDEEKKKFHFEKAEEAVETE